MFHELAINCRNFSFSKKGRSNCAGRRISIRKGGEAMGPLAGAVAFPAYDANGNITEYAGDGGEILSHCDYSAFGRELIKTGSDDFTHRFSTKPLCRKMGVLEYQLRKYNPWCGRWINRDAIEEDGGLNLYGFVWNKVTVLYDAKGCFSSLASVAIGALYAAACSQYAENFQGTETDGFKHCVASCRFSNCMSAMSGALGGAYLSLVGGIINELWQGRDGGNNLGSALRDIQSNLVGIMASLNPFSPSCEDACKCEDQWND